MKTIYNYLLLAVLVSLFGCDKHGELNESVSGFYSVSTTFVYPQGANANYIILLDGDTLKNGSGVVSRSGKSLRKLEVFEKGKSTADLSQDIEINEDKLFQFIKLQGQPLTIYEADKYTTIKVNIIFASGEDASSYKVLFNNTELPINSQVINYIPIDQLTGTLEIKKEEQTVYSNVVTFQLSETLNYMQLSESEYLSLPNQPDLEAPTQSNTNYTRFFFFSKDVNGAQQLELTTYYVAQDRVTYEKIETIVLNAGEVSTYSLYDFNSGSLTSGQRRRGFVYNLKNLETGEVLVDFNEMITKGLINTDLRGTSYKFNTCQISNNGQKIAIVVGNR